MSKNQACEPCAKRKVRCDHGDPCANCKRRKTDHCTYPTVSPQDRIKQLEALVRKLGGSAELNVGESTNRGDHAEAVDHQGTGHTNDDGLLYLTTLQSQSSGRQINTPIETRSKDPVVLEENGQPLYLESRAWRGWLGYDSNDTSNHTKSKLPFAAEARPHALASINAGLTSATPHERYPTAIHANTLWSIFMDRVEPLARICYTWWLEDFRTRTLEDGASQQLSVAEHALLSAIYLVSAVSMFDDECESLLHKPRSTLVLEYQLLCEEALVRTNLFCMNDIIVFKAVIFYLAAGYDRLSVQSLWSLTGLAIRSAEKLGMHRDGTVLGLGPAQTEERRRVWWQLQQIDMGVGVRSGLTSMTLMADWDAKMPLNIEDEDISPKSTELPQARKGLTRISLNRFYWFVFDQQRKTFQAKQARFALSWQSNTALSSTLKDSVLHQLEEDVNKEFLQYCDPINPLHVLIQFLARFLNYGMRLRTLHPLAYKDDKGNINQEHRSALLETAMKCLQYNNAVQSRPDLKKFYWTTKTWAPFHAFMCVLVEAAREEDTSKAQEIWNLISNTYAINRSFWELSEDRRKYQAAELVVTAWKTWQKRFDSRLQLSNPGFAEELERELIKTRRKMNGETVPEPAQQENHRLENTMMTPESLGLDGDSMNADFDMDFQDIDWSFWSGIE